VTHAAVWDAWHEHADTWQWISGHIAGHIDPHYGDDDEDLSDLAPECAPADTLCTVRDFRSWEKRARTAGVSPKDRKLLAELEAEARGDG